MEEITKHKHLSRVRKSKNFPGCKIFHPKTFWIKRVNLDIFDFATNVRKTRQFHVFYPDRLWIVRTVSRISRQSQDYPDSFQIIRTISELFQQSLDYSDSFQNIRTVSEQFSNHPKSFLANRTVLNKIICPGAHTYRIFAKAFWIAMLPRYHGFSNSAFTYDTGPSLAQVPSRWHCTMH